MQIELFNGQITVTIEPDEYLVRWKRVDGGFVRQIRVPSEVYNVLMALDETERTENYKLAIDLLNYLAQR